jgi:hypothetical protein
MDTRDIARQISMRDFDLDKSVRAVILTESVRDEIVKLMISHADIMVYYHCFEVVSQASQEHPELFYRYWHDIVPLLSHKNSYHRDFALTILANLTAVDNGALFSELYRDYFAHIHDQKFMTARCCIQNAAKVISNTPALQDEITTLLIELGNHCTFTTKQQALLKYDVLLILEGVFEEVSPKKRTIDFVTSQVSSISPKARNKARDLVRKYQL